MKTQATTAALLLALFGSIAGIAHATSHSHAGAVEAQATMADGEVRKVDKDAKKLTIRHGAIANLDMPPMTMVFQVTDATMLERLKTGDKIRFSAERIGGAYTVTQIEAPK